MHLGEVTFVAQGKYLLLVAVVGFREGVVFDIFILLCALFIIYLFSMNRRHVSYFVYEYIYIYL